MKDDNGRIKMTWGQVVWALSTLTILLGSWFDLRSRVDRISEIMTANGQRISKLEERNRRVGFTQDNAEAMADELMSGQDRIVTKLSARISALERRVIGDK